MSWACLVELPGSRVFSALGDGTGFFLGCFLLTGALELDVFFINRSFNCIAATACGGNVSNALKLDYIKLI
jgi:hypothetical protein